MENNVPSISNHVPPTTQEMNVEQQTSTDQHNRDSDDPLSQDEVLFLLTPRTSVFASTVSEDISSTTVEDVALKAVDDISSKSVEASPANPLSGLKYSATLSPQFDPGPTLPDVNCLTISDHPCALTVAHAEGHPREENEQEYILREIFFNGCTRKIMTQNVNGPCPLIAVVNALVLKGKFAFNHNEFKVSLTRVLDAVGEKILIEKDRRGDCEALDANVESALETLRHSPHGLDVNVRFGKVDDFEFTAVHSFFDILDVSLFHGWIADEGILSVIGNRAYNEVTAYITEDSNEARLIKEWLEFNQSQLTFEGLTMLRDKLCNGGVAIMFRNNHFTTITKYNDTIYILLTDMGFISLDVLVFESLVDINQSSSVFTNGNFEEVNADGSVKEWNGRKNESPLNGDIHNDNDLAYAVSLQEEEMRLEREREKQDAEMRARNNEDERRRHHQQMQQQQRTDNNEKKKSSVT